MSRTIGRHWPKTARRGDYQAMCDHCGVLWRRSQLHRDGAGSLVCPDEGDGRDSVTLDALNAASAQELTGPVSQNDGGNFFKAEGDDVYLDSLEDIEL